MNSFWDWWKPPVGGHEKKSGLYSKLRFECRIGTNGAASLVFERKFDVRGDHLTVHELSGPAPLYVRLGVDENPFIRIRQGMILRRPFNGFTVRVGSPPRILSDYSLGYLRATFFATYGPFAEYPPRELGMRRQFAARRDLTAPLWAGAGTAETIGGQWATAAGFLATEGLTVGKFEGGILTIRNKSVAVPLLVFPAAANAGTHTLDANDAIEIGPGEVREFPLLENVLNTNRDDATGWRVAGDGGTCPYAVDISSPELDDVDGDQARQHFPSME